VEDRKRVKEEIHLWEIPNLHNLFVCLDDEFREKLFRQVINKVGLYSDILRFYSQVCKRDWFELSKWRSFL